MSTESTCKILPFYSKEDLASIRYQLIRDAVRAQREKQTVQRDAAPEESQLIETLSRPQVVSITEGLTPRQLRWRAKKRCGIESPAPVSYRMYQTWCIEKSANESRRNGMLRLPNYRHRVA